MDTIININTITRNFHIPKAKQHWWKSLFSRHQVVNALNPLTLSINRGERLILLGKNGSGKSTLIKLLSGIIVPNSGEINILGFTPHQRKAQFLRTIGVMFGQKSFLFPDLNVIDALDLYAIIYQIDHTTYQERLKLLDTYLDFQRLLYRPVRKLSLGERMRCEVVAAIIHDPKIILLDEPSTGMDIDTINGLIRLLNDLSDKYTLIIATHDLKIIKSLNSRIILLDKGNYITDISSEKVYSLINSICYTFEYTGQENIVFHENIINLCKINQHNANKFTIICSESNQSDIYKILIDNPNIISIETHSYQLDLLIDQYIVKDHL